MIYAYIGVLLVVSLLIGFAALAVCWLARSVGRSIRSRTLELVSVYDDLLEVRSRQLAQLERQALQVQPAGAAAQPVPTPAVVAPANVSLNMVARMGSTAYRSNLLGDAYRQIRQGFDFSPQTVLRQIQQQTAAPTGAPATELLAGLSCEVVCGLSALPGETQYQLLHESLAPAQQALLEAYQNGRAGFDSLGFYDYLRQTAYTEPKAPVLRVAPTAAVGPVPGAALMEDDAICEGFQLEVNGQIYDYCIKTREIS